MKGRKKHLLTPVAGAIATALSPAQQALAQDQDNEAVGLEEVLVTATKVTTSVQDIAATVQAITSDDLAAMGAKGMDDYSRFIPSMSVISSAVDILGLPGRNLAHHYRLPTRNPHG